MNYGRVYIVSLVSVKATLDTFFCLLYAHRWYVSSVSPRQFHGGSSNMEILQDGAQRSS